MKLLGKRHDPMRLIDCFCKHRARCWDGNGVIRTSILVCAIGIALFNGGLIHSASHQVVIITADYSQVAEALAQRM